MAPIVKVWRMFAFGVLLVLLLGGSSVYLLPLLGGAVFTYVWVTATFAIIGWCIYNDYRDGQPETLANAKISYRFLDVGDVFLIIMTYVSFIYLVDSDSSTLTLGAVFGGGTALALVRRRFFPSSTVPFHPKNLALRITSIFLLVQALATLCFAILGPDLDQADDLTLAFALLGGALLACASWARKLELRRYSVFASEDGGAEDGRAEDGGAEADGTDGAAAS